MMVFAAVDGTLPWNHNTQGEASIHPTGYLRRGSGQELSRPLPLLALSTTTTNQARPSFRGGAATYGTVRYVVQGTVLVRRMVVHRTERYAFESPSLLCSSFIATGGWRIGASTLRHSSTTNRAIVSAPAYWQSPDPPHRPPTRFIATRTLTRARAGFDSSRLSRLQSSHQANLNSRRQIGAAFIGRSGVSSPFVLAFGLGSFLCLASPSRYTSTKDRRSPLPSIN